MASSRPPEPPPRPTTNAIGVAGRSLTEVASTGPSTQAVDAVPHGDRVTLSEPDPGSSWLPDVLRQRLDKMSCVFIEEDPLHRGAQL